MVSSATIPNAIEKTIAVDGFRSKPPSRITPRSIARGNKFGRRARSPRRTERNIHASDTQTRTTERSTPGKSRAII